MRQEFTDTIEEVVQELTPIPEVSYALATLSESIVNPLSKLSHRDKVTFAVQFEGYIRETFFDYLRIVYDFTTLTPDDLKLITEANLLSTELGLKSNSASKGGAEHLYEILGEERLMHLHNSISQLLDHDSLLFKASLNDLFDRMSMGSSLKRRAVILEDNASHEADTAIWGHTKSLTTNALVQFIESHFIARAFSNIFISDEDPQVQALAEEKDSFLTAIGDVIKLRTAQGKISPVITAAWSFDQRNGGLNWISAERQDVYNHVVNQASLKAGRKL